jgi:hypothetical protein
MNDVQDAGLLSVYPNARGFGFVVLDERRRLIDWGISDLRREQRIAKCLHRLQRLIDRYRPRVLVVREMTGAEQHAVDMFEAIKKLADSRGVLVVAISRRQIREAFAHLGSPNRSTIADALARQMPVLAPFIPPVRKIWNGEDRRMGLFDAVALAVTFQSLAG